MVQEREVEIPAYDGPQHHGYDRYTFDGFGFTAFEHLFYFRRLTIGVFGGPAFSFETPYSDMEYLGYDLWAEYFQYSVGPFLGVEGEYALGPGKIFITCNFACLFGIGGSHIEDPTPYNGDSKGNLERAYALSIGLGYRFGFIAKKSK
jgi:hypothetical protein